MNSKKYTYKVEGGKCIEEAHYIGYIAAFKSEQGYSNHEQIYAVVQDYCKENTNIN